MTDLRNRLNAHHIGLSDSQRSFHRVTARAWQAVHGNLPIAPTTQRLITDFVVAQAAAGRSGRPLAPQTIKRMLAVISGLHTKVHQIDDPTRHILVTSEMKALYRERGSIPKAIVPLRLKEDVADVVADNPLPGSIIHMLRRLADDRSPWALRARVVLGLGADTGRTRSEYVRLDIADAVAMPDGTGQAFFNRPLSDREAGEAPRLVSADTMAFIGEWLAMRERIYPSSTRPDQPLLTSISQTGVPTGRLSVYGYVDVLKDIMRRVGDGLPVSGNSFRAGLKLDLAAIGATPITIANALGFSEL